MPHETALLATLTAAFALAFVLGVGAARLGLPPLAGYLLAGVALGPTAPWRVADVALAGQLAEFGVILLMFGVGLHFAPRDLLAARRVALPGALVQVPVHEQESRSERPSRRAGLWGAPHDRLQDGYSASLMPNPWPPGRGTGDPCCWG